MPLYINTAIRSAYADDLLRNAGLSADEKIQKIYDLFDKTSHVRREVDTGHYFYDYESLQGGQSYTGLAVNEAGLNGWTLLHKCALHGEWEVAERLIEQQGAAVDIMESPIKDNLHYATPLFLAAGCTGKNALPMVRTLIAHGADINARSRSDSAGGIFANMIPLHHAVRHGQVDVVELLLNMGCKTDIKMGKLSEAGVHFYQRKINRARSAGDLSPGLRMMERDLHESMTPIEYALYLREILLHEDHPEAERFLGTKNPAGKPGIPSIHCLDEMIDMLRNADVYASRHAVLSELKNSSVKKFPDVCGTIFSYRRLLAAELKKAVEKKSMPEWEFDGTQKNQKSLPAPLKVSCDIKNKYFPPYLSSVRAGNFFVMQELRGFSVIFSRSSKYFLVDGKYEINGFVVSFQQKICNQKGACREIQKFLDEVIDGLSCQYQGRIVFLGSTVSCMDFSSGNFAMNFSPVNVSGIKNILKEWVIYKILPEERRVECCVM